MQINCYRASRHRWAVLVLLAVSLLVWGTGRSGSADDTVNPDTTPQPAETIGETESVTSDDALSEQQRNDLDFLRSVLQNPNNELNTHIGAAERLLSMGIAEADDIMIEGLTRGTGHIPQAVLSALATTATPRAALLQPSVALLPAASENMWDLLAQALERYGDLAIEHITPIARNQDLPEVERFGAIYTLGVFRLPKSAQHLMALLDPARAESSAITCASCDSLSRLSGFPYGCDTQRWEQWWTGIQSLTRNQWNESMARQLGNRIAELERSVHQERQRHTQTVQRLTATYANLFPALSIEQQFEQLPALMEDQLLPVREFALARVDRLMRDSVRIPAPVQEKLVGCLDDPQSPKIRKQAAELLDQLGYENIALLVSERLGSETSPDIVSSYLEILSHRPMISVLDPLVKWLGDPDLGHQAAKAIWLIPDLNSSSVEQQQALQLALREQIATTQPISHTRLLAFIGTEEDIATLELLLDGESPEIRSAIAEGFARRNHQEPLLVRAKADPAIYPWALATIANGPRDLDNFRKLMLLQGIEEQYAAWSETARTITSTMSEQDLLTVDEILAQSDSVPEELRIELMMRAAAAPVTPEGIEQRAALLVRLSPLLMQHGQAQQAHALFAQLNGGINSSAALKRERFRAAALSSRYDLAAEETNDPQAWIQLLAWIMNFDQEAATRLTQEIKSRFAEQLNEQMLAELQSIDAVLGISDEAGDASPPTDTTLTEGSTDEET